MAKYTKLYTAPYTEKLGYLLLGQPQVTIRSEARIVTGVVMRRVYSPGTLIRIGYSKTPHEPPPLRTCFASFPNVRLSQK